MNGYAPANDFRDCRDTAVVIDIGAGGRAGNQYIGTGERLETSVAARPGRSKRLQLQLRCGFRTHLAPSCLVYDAAHANDRTIATADATAIGQPRAGHCGGGPPRRITRRPPQAPGFRTLSETTPERRGPTHARASFPT